MVFFVRRSILKEFLVVVSYTFLACLPAQIVLAQRPVPSPPHPAGAAVRVPVPVAPISHPQVFQPPLIRSSILYAPTPAYRLSTNTQPPGVLGRPVLWPPRHPIRPRPPLVLLYSPQFIFGGPWWGFEPCWSTTCDLFWEPWTSSFTTVSSSGPIVNVSQEYEPPVYAYGEERPDLPQIYLKDGTILNVTDYWLVDDQLRFSMTEEGGAKPAEQAVPFDEVDLQKTVDANTRRGFRFVLRNEPFEQYLRDHPDGPPPEVSPPHK